MPRFLKFDTKIGYDKLYCILKSQQHMAYQSLYFVHLSFFPIFFFIHISSACISARVFKLYIHDEDDQVYYCIQNQGAKIYLCLPFLFFSFSTSHSKVLNI